MLQQQGLQQPKLRWPAPGVRTRSPPQSDTRKQPERRMEEELQMAEPLYRDLEAEYAVPGQPRGQRHVVPRAPGRCRGGRYVFS